MNYSFSSNVLSVVKKIPYGRVASYAQIASMAGSERGARAVGWILHRLNKKDLERVPWHRVISSKGYITTSCKEHTAILQKELLEKEGINVQWDDRKKMYYIDMGKYCF